MTQTAFDTSSWVGMGTHHDVFFLEQRGCVGLHVSCDGREILDCLGTSSEDQLALRDQPRRKNIR